MTFGDAIAITLSLGLCVLGAAWLTILPAIGTLWVLGWLS